MFNNPESAIMIWIFPRNSANQEIPGDASDIGAIIYAEKECVTDVTNKFRISSDWHSHGGYGTVTGAGGSANITPKNDTENSTYYCKLIWKHNIIDKMYKIAIITTMDPDPPMKSFTMDILVDNGDNSVQVVTPKQQCVAKYSSSVSSDPTKSYKVYQGALILVEKDSDTHIQTIDTLMKKELKGSVSFLAPEEEGYYVFYLYEGIIAPSNITATPTSVENQKPFDLIVKK